MAVTATSFKVTFPEFADLTDAYIQERLDTAVAAHSALVYSTALYDDIIEYYTAHLLNVTTFGQQMAIDPQADGETIYSRQYRKFLLLAARRAMVL